MVYDCFSFFNELDLLEIRLNVLKDVVDKFVLVEATRTHTGAEKSLYFKENEARFSAFRDRIVHIVVDDFTLADAASSIRERAWAIENIQRNAVLRGLGDAKADDTILISDLDEIPDPDAVRRVVGLSGITRFGMKAYNYFLNYRNYTSDQWLLGTQALSYSEFCNPSIYEGFRFGEYVIERVNAVPSASMVRFMEPTRVLRNAGWHFSYMGGIEMIRKKIKSIAHTEFNTEATTSKEWIKVRIENGEDPFRRGDRYFADVVDASFPAYLRDNQERFRDMLYAVDDDYLKRTACQRRKAMFFGRMKRIAVFLIPTVAVPFVMRTWNRLHGVRSSKDAL